MKKIYLQTLFFSLILIGTSAKGIAQEQNNGISVGILPFLYAQESFQNRAAQLQEVLAEVLTARPGITLRDRSRDGALKQELEAQKQGESFNASFIVEQGKVLGAQQIIVGKVANVGVEKKTSTDYNPVTKRNTTNTSYSASITFSLLVMDAATGASIAAKTFDLNGNSGGLSLFGSGSTEEGAVSSVIKKSRDVIAKWINMEAFPPQIKILRIEEKDSKNLPKTVLISGIDKSVKTGSIFTVNQEEVISDGAANHTRVVPLGIELKITELQGAVAVAKVVRGKDIIESKINPEVKLTFKLK